MIRLLALIGAASLLAACFETQNTGRDPSGTPAQETPAGTPVLRDPDGNPVFEVPVDMLVDIRRQMLESGRQQHAAALEAAYDFQTGKWRGQPPAPSK